MKPLLLSLKHSMLGLNSLDTLSDIRIRAFMLLFNADAVYHKPKPSLLGASSVVNHFHLK